MEKLECKNCGGVINPNTYTCEYCGTKYKRDYNDQIVRIEHFQNPVRVYTSQVILPKDQIDCMGTENVSKVAIAKLSRNLADAIAENMELYTEYDPYYMQQKITARIRIVEPKYMF